MNLDPDLDPGDRPPTKPLTPLRARQKFIKQCYKVATVWHEKATPTQSALRTFRLSPAISNTQTRLSNTLNQLARVQVAAQDLPHCQSLTYMLLRKTSLLIDCLGDLVYYTREEQARLGEISRTLNSSFQQTRNELCLDLLQLAEEFSDVIIEPNSLAITTKPIMLQDMNFGPFQIMLILNPPNFLVRVTALEPFTHPDDRHCVHPYVLDQGICMGDSFALVMAAIRQRRIFDAFYIIHGLLCDTGETANPYHPASDWDGANSDDRTYCDSCGRRCDDDNYGCAHCDATVCLNCAYECTECGLTMCPNCSWTCEDCGSAFCQPHSDFGGADDPRRSVASCTHCYVTCSSCGERVRAANINADGPRPLCLTCATTPTETPV